MKVLTIDVCSEIYDDAPARLFNSFVEGMRKGGADVEYHNTANMKIEACRGCTASNDFFSDGTCQCRDDMTPLLQSFKNSEAWVFAYRNTSADLSEKMSNILDRLEPLFQPKFDLNQIEDKIEISKNGNTGKFLLFATTDLWDLSHFDYLVSQFRSVANLYSKEFLPPILRPHAGVLTALGSMSILTDDIFQAAYEAGEIFAQEGFIPKEKTEIISRELVPKDSFIQEVSRMLAYQ